MKNQQIGKTLHKISKNADGGAVYLSKNKEENSMYQLSRRVLALMICMAMSLTAMTTVVFGQSSRAQQYASKVLYALDQADLVHTQDGTTAVRESAANYPYVEVLGTSDGLAVWQDLYYQGEYAGIGQGHAPVKYLSAGLSGPDPAVKNITYKITSSNPNGFEGLDISFLGRAESVVESGEPVSFLAVQGSTTAPTGEFGADGYFDGFSDLRRITDSDPGREAHYSVGRDNATPDYFNFGETLSLTTEVRGSKVYYVNFSYCSEELMLTALTDISFAEKVPVEFADDTKYDSVVMVSGDYTNLERGNFYWNEGTNGAANLARDLGISAEYCDYSDFTMNGAPFFSPMITTDISKRSFSFVPIGDGWGFASVTYKLQAPAGKTFQGLQFDYDGNLEVVAGTAPNSAVAITTYVGSSPNDMGIAGRLMSYTDENGDLHNLGTDLDAFQVAVDGESEIWVKTVISGGDFVTAYTEQYGDQLFTPYGYIQKMMVKGIFDTNKISQGEEISDPNYASKVLYAMDTAKIIEGNPSFGNLSAKIAASAEGYANVEVVGITDNITAWGTNIGNPKTSGYDAPVERIASLMGEGQKNITYKITSSNPDGFDELDISYYTGVESRDGSAYLAIQGSSQPPIGEFGGADYFSTFADIKKIVDGTPSPEAGNVEVAPQTPKNYHDYGETVVLTDAVKGKKEYYINVCMNSDFMGAAWISDLSFTEKVKVDFTNTNRYSTVALTDMNYVNEMNGNFIGSMWQSGDPNAEGNAAAIAAPTDNCKVVDIKRWLMFLGESAGKRYLSFPGTAGAAGEQVNWSGGAVVLKLTAPEGKVFAGLNVDLGGKNTMDACAGPNLGDSITVGISDEYALRTGGDAGQFNTGMGTVKRFYSYNNAQGVVAKNTGDLTPFKVLTDGQKEIYLKLAIGGGLDGWNYINRMKIEGVFAEESIIESVDFNGKGAFPTDGTLTAQYKLGSPKEGEQMPKNLTLILAAYQTDDKGVNRLIAVKTINLENPQEKSTHTVELTGLPQDANNCSAKAYVWSNFNTMTPISSVYELGAE